MRLRCFLSNALVALVLLAGSPAQAGDRLGELTWPEAKAALVERPVVVVPFAAGAKEHGPHLPLNTDARVLNYLLDAAVQASDVLIAPPILHGWFPGFRAFPGTEVADASVFQDYVKGVAESLARQGAKRILFLNMGITRATGLPLAIVARDIRVEHDIPTLVVSWDDLETDAVAEFSEQERGGHADELETSVMLAIDAAMVHMDRAKQDYRTQRSPVIGYAPGKFDAEEIGVFGDPTLATRSKGERTLAIMRERWLSAIKLFAKR